MKKDKAVFFDCYQTLIDVNFEARTQKANEQKGWEVFAGLLSEKYGVGSSPSELVALINRRKADYYIGKDETTFHYDFKKVVTDVLEKDLKHSLASEVISELIYEYRKISRGYLRLHHPKVIEVLSALASTYTVCVASYTQSSFTRPELEELGIGKYFSYFVFSSDIGFRKTSTEFYKKCTEVVGRTSAECVMIGDNYREDVLIPSQLGMNTVWIKNSEAEASAVEAGAIVSIEEFSTLPGVVDRVFEK